jgi:hypothetical protein
MTLVAHVDDSGSEPSGGHFVLSGFVHNAEAWAQFSDEWSTTLKAAPYSVEYLKASEVWDKNKGPFKDGMPGFLCTSFSERNWSKRSWKWHEERSIPLSRL